MPTEKTPEEIRIQQLRDGLKQICGPRGEILDLAEWVKKCHGNVRGLDNSRRLEKSVNDLLEALQDLRKTVDHGIELVGEIYGVETATESPLASASNGLHVQHGEITNDAR